MTVCPWLPRSPEIFKMRGGSFCGKAHDREFVIPLMCQFRVKGDDKLIF
jgi:hypothetical protein